MTIEQGGPGEHVAPNPLEVYKQTLAETHATYDELMDSFFAEDGVFAGEDGQKLWEQVSVGLISSLAIDQEGVRRSPLGAEQEGVRSDDCHVVFGDLYPFGNMEGSLYTTYGEAENKTMLRNRWNGGDKALYLNGWGNYIDTYGRNGTDGFVPGRIHGKQIIGVTEDGRVELKSEATKQYDREMSDLARDKAHRAEVYAQKSPMQKLAALAVSRIVKEDEPVEPVKPANDFIPVEELTAMLEEVKVGLTKTAETLQAAKLSVTTV